ncbi:MAG: MBL fold metallo-hydrolase [Leptolyngbyaceae bacterium]|nr:MBL fold metallo-hydrolase [Leptolyngbyaceae bacterium]
MNRRQLMRYAQTSVLAAMGTGLASGLHTYQAQAQAKKNQPQAKPKAQPQNALSIQWLGHTCFLLTGGNQKLQRVLVNPFRPGGCTAGYREPKLATDLILVSSSLLDEGAIEVVTGDPKLLYEAGPYQVDGIRFEGIKTDHDRVGGRRFGSNVVWRWTQAGINILHLGGIAAPVTLEQKILMLKNRPDVLFLPVGGSAKAYTPQEAKQAVQELNPRLIIPTHYRTQAAKENACDLVPVQEFLALMEGIPVRRLGNTITVKSTDLPSQGPEIAVLSYKF